MADGSLGLRPSFAGSNALVPRVIKLGVTRTSAVSDPRTTATTTTNFTRFRDGATFGAYRTVWRCRECWCVYLGIGQNTNREKCEKSHCWICARIYLHGFSLGLTFAGLDAFKPPVLRVPVADTSTILVPSTTRSATTDSAGFLKRAALWTHRLTGRGDP